MSHLFAPLISHLESIIEHGGYIVLFFVSVFEGIPIIGQFVPGHTLVILSGFLAKVHVLSLFKIVPIVIIGAFLGDFIGYSIGKKYGYEFLTRIGKYFFIKDEHIEKAKKMMHEHVRKTIIIGRFSPITRTIAPFSVGASGVGLGKFIIYDIIGVLLWSIGSIAIGYIFGASYGSISILLGKFTVIAIITGLLIAWGYRFINKQFHIFAKYELITLFFNLAGLYIFFKTIQDAISDHAFMAELDVWINIFFSLHTVRSLVVFMNIITNIISPTSITIVGIIGIVYFLYKKYWRYATITIFSIGGGLMINAFIKALVMRERPEGAFIIETGYSFPSGHAVAATIFFTLIIYFFARKINSLIWRELFITVSVILILLTAFSRIYLGVHWLSDVVAGIGFGLLWTTFMILIVRYIGMIFVKFRNAGK